MRANLSAPRLTLTQRGICAAALCLLSACATRLDPAPVVDLSGGGNPAAPAPGPVAPVAAAPAPLGPPPPGYYRVRPGDTLSAIARSNGHSAGELIGWNNLSDPNHIEVDQLLRVVPPGAGGGPAPVGVPVGVPVGAPAAVAVAPGPVAPPVAPSVAAAPADNQPPAADAGSLALAWPVRGPLLGRFNDSSNKGIDIGGSAGEPVHAAAGGRVVYAGNGLRGYGNLVIVKSDATFLTAYAHNRELKVKEGDNVSKGQVIAAMGNTDSDRVMLHFEVRRDGKPVDPLRYLPPQ
ncbi:peptidoglycan DD-metalloendopeptidase family protein [Paraburkholderia sp. J12]|uniref:peptidoglycan DD-metalloendopeptidase family protein n=1 Tax=Paraburkholderia sp. J12 TaxID=2805432 RepID=UPI002ABE0A6D|nr:peptidoglycan DD-metalloendopeptidase family protein [Paraburkholderia sp. J12]